MRLAGRTFLDNGHTYVMGILNVTPDSFSDGGRFISSSRDKVNIDLVLSQAEKMVADGADILDIGGESTRPGAEFVSLEAEIERVVPVIEAISSRLDTVISLDTYKSEVAKAGIEAGAHLINDIWGLRGDKNMASIIGAYSDIAVCIMHNRKAISYGDIQEGKTKEQQVDTPNTAGANTDVNYGYVSFMDDVISDLRKSIEIANMAGIGSDKIILDPGVGFAKTYEQNLESMRYMERISELGCPILLGASRKSVIGNTLNVPADERLYGTLATTAVAVNKGIQFVRVHDVRPNVELIRMMEAIRG